MNCRERTQRLKVAGCRLPQMSLEFGEGQFNRVEIGAVRRQITDPHSQGRKDAGNGLYLMGGEVVEDERIALVQVRTEHLLKIDREDLRIHRAFHPEGGVDAFVAQGRQEGGTLPMPMREGTGATLPDRAATMNPGQFGVQARFIDKHQPADIPIGLWLVPKLPRRFNIRPILLGGARRFFYSSGPTAPTGATRRRCRWAPPNCSRHRFCSSPKVKSGGSAIQRRKVGSCFSRRERR